MAMHIVKEERSRLYGVRGALLSQECELPPNTRAWGFDLEGRLDRNYDTEAIFLHRDLTDGPDRSTVRYHGRQ